MATSKRRAEAFLKGAAKKLKSEPLLFHTCSRRSAVGVLASECKDPNVFLSVKVVMIWRPDSEANEFSYKVCFRDMIADHEPDRFEVIFTGRCLVLWHYLDIAIDDELELSMRGASFVHISLNQHDRIKLPFQLAYGDGCIIKFIRRRGKINNTVINLWNVDGNALVEPDIDYTKDVIIFPLSSSQAFIHQNQLLESNEANDVSVNPHHFQVIENQSSNPQNRTAEAQLPCDVLLSTKPKPLEMPAKETAKEKRFRKFKESIARKKQEKTARRQNKTPNTGSLSSSESKDSDPSSVHIQGKVGVMLDVQAVPSTTFVQSVVAQSEPSVPPIHKLEEIPESLPKNKDQDIIFESESPALDLNAGWHGYRALGDVVLPEAIGKNHAVIAVVTKSKELSKSSKGDWSQSVNLVDPSNLHPSDAVRYRRGDGLRVNLFTKQYREWLPTPKEGDVIILKAIKPIMFNNAVLATVYHDRLKWSIYDPDTHKLRHGDRKDAPASESIDGGHGATLCPYFVPPEPQHELYYCQKLSEWWKAVMAKRRNDMGDVHQIEPSMTRPRIHRLIADAGQDSEPNGYFDCTVEVFQGYQNVNGVYSLYVTDYTQNRGLHINDRWGDKLQHMILKIEMWDAAAAVGPTMVPNGFYYLKNCRMMLKDSYLEGKLVETKIIRLDENKDTENEAFMKLLARKAAMNEQPVQPPPQWKIEDAESERFFNCIVELLHTVCDKRETFIFVTDYTLNNKFLGCAPTEPWSEGLDGRIIKVKVYGNVNTKKVGEMPVGSFYKLGKLRFWQSSKTWVCHLKEVGSIMRMNAKFVADDGLKDLLVRREQWKKSRANISKDAIQYSNHELPRAVSAQPGALDFPRLEECPSRFSAVARVVDFYPKRLEDCLVLQCGKCHKELRGLLKACTDCSEATMENATVVYRCAIFFILSDRSGKEIVAAVCDPDCSLIKDINGDNEEAYIAELKSRFKPILGNLAEVHDGMERGEKIEVNTVEMKFDVVVWLEKTDSGDKKRCAILDCKSL